MMISPEQIKAARAWIDLTRDALAEEAGVSAATIRNLERGKVSHRSAETVRAALEIKGFRFHGRNGLSRPTDENKTYEGANSRDEFYEDVLTTAKQRGGEIAVLFKTQDLLTRSLGITDDDRLDRISELAKFATIKCLLSDVRQLSLYTSPRVQIRAAAHNPLGPLGTFIYADKTAVVVSNGRDFVFHVTKSMTITHDTWKGFASCWETAMPLNPQTGSSRKRN